MKRIRQLYKQLYASSETQIKQKNLKTQLPKQKKINEKSEYPYINQINSSPRPFPQRIYTGPESFTADSTKHFKKK